jgi:hypothetical protein
MRHILKTKALLLPAYPFLGSFSIQNIPEVKIRDLRALPNRIQIYAD